MADLFIWFILGGRGEMFTIVSISLVTNSLKNIDTSSVTRYSWICVHHSIKQFYQKRKENK